MTARQYRFESNWVLEAPVGEVWGVITESLKWPEWWPSVQDVAELKQGDENGIGSLRRYSLKSPMLYRLRFELTLCERLENRLLSGAVTGDLEGTGTWLFSEKEGRTTATCLWEVSTRPVWMNLLAPICAPLFSINHRWVMQEGARCLAKKMAAKLLSC